MSVSRSILRCFAFCAAMVAAVPTIAHCRSPVETDAPAAQRAKADWRYRYHRGRWWYWLPSNSWAYYNGNRWVAYETVRRANEPQANGNPIGSNGRYQYTESTGRWPNSNNGSGVDAAPVPGGAPAGRSGSLPPHGRWPRGDNGSGVDAAPTPGGSPYKADRNLPPRGRWPRGDNGSGVDAAPEPGGAAFIRDE